MKKLIKLILVSFTTLACLQVAYAQSTRKERKAAKVESIMKMVDEMHYVFDANFVIPQSGAARSLTSSYDITVSRDTIKGYLPYFGVAYVAPIHPNEGPIDFTYTSFDYNVTKSKKGGWDIVIKPKQKDKNISDFKDVQELRLSISSDGYAYLQVISSNRQQISFNGTIEEPKVESKKDKAEK